MVFYDTTWWQALNNLVMVGWILFLCADAFRSRAAKGTHPRYVWATLQWATAFPALGFPLVHLLQDIAERSMLGLVIDAILMWLWTMTFLAFKRADDDNWFRRTGKRLRRWAEDTLSALSPLPV